jgi:beta-glucanase (GH16 family)/pectate lyase
MKKRTLRIPLLVMHCICVCYILPINVQSQVRTWPTVPGEKTSEAFWLEVEGQNVPVYQAPINREIFIDGIYKDMDPEYSYAYFDFAGKVTVKVHSAKSLEKLVIRPISKNISYSVEDTTLLIHLDHPCNISVERNGRNDPLLIFAGPLEEEVPEQASEGVIFFGPGKHWPGVIRLESNQTLYISGGAVVHGSVEASGDNIQIIGRGLLLTEKEPYPIVMENCTDSRLEGITIRNMTRGWTVTPKNCDNLLISNIRILGSCAPNDDGIDPVNSRNVEIKNCFIRTRDDCIAIKGMAYGNSNVDNIRITNCMLWSDLCCSILIGDECRADYMKNITIEDCWIPHLSYPYHVKKFLMVHAGEETRMENIRLKNIDIHGNGWTGVGQFIEIACEFNQYTKTQVAGNIDGLYLQDINITGIPGPFPMLIQGYDKNHLIKNVQFDNVRINGKLLTENYPNLEVGPFVEGLCFTGQDRDANAWELSWSDEFDRDGAPDTSRWSYLSGEADYNERENLSYSDNPLNIKVEKGKLILTVTKVKPGYGGITSAAIHTRGKKHFRFGKFVIRAKINKMECLWPQCRIAGTKGNWPASGSIHLMDCNLGQVAGNFVYGDKAAIWDKGIKELYAMDAYWFDRFHVWELEWDKDSAVIRLDGEELNSFQIDDAQGEDGNPFYDWDHYISLGLATGSGGDGPFQPFPQSMEVDYIRVYRNIHNAK